MKDLYSEKTLFKGHVRAGLYHFHASSIDGNQQVFAAHAKASQHTWHQRLGHPGFKIINKLVSKSCISLSNALNKTICSSCALGKSSKLPFASVSCISSKHLELLHTDVWGPTPLLSIKGYHYYIIFVDDYTKYTWFFPHTSKSDVFDIFVKFKSLVENLLSSKIVTIRSDSGGEFLSLKFINYLQLHGISHQLSYPHTPEQNGCAERKYRHLVETARTLLVACKVPKLYWDDAFATTIYLINRMPTATKPFRWEILFPRSADYTSLKVFGCRCFPWLKPYTSSKLDPKSK